MCILAGYKKIQGTTTMRSSLIPSLVFLLASLASPLLLAAPGDLDTSFGGGAGWVSTAPLTRPGNDFANSVIQQTDGKLVAAGYSHTASGNNDDFALVRYNSD